MERLRVFLASYYSFDQETLKNKVFHFILGIKMKKLKSLELGFEMLQIHIFLFSLILKSIFRCNLTDEAIFPNFLKSLGQKLKQENKDDLGVLSIFLYA